MTTEWKLTMSPNLFEEDAEVRLPAPLRDAYGTGLAALTVVCPVELDVTSSRLACLQHAYSMLEREYPSYGLWLFAIHTLWQPDTKVRRHKKLWQTLAESGAELPKERTSEEVLESQDGIKFYSRASVNRDDLAKVGGILAKEPGSLVLSAPHDRSVLHRELLAAGWGTGDHLSLAYWRDLAMAAAHHANILFRPVGAFDDREAGFNLISTPDVVRSIAADLASGHRAGRLFRVP